MSQLFMVDDLTESDDNNGSESPKRISMQEAEHALEALGNLLYLIEIDHREEEHLEAYLLMTRTAIETLNRWFYDDPCREFSQPS